MLFLPGSFAVTIRPTSCTIPPIKVTRKGKPVGVSTVLLSAGPNASILPRKPSLDFYPVSLVVNLAATLNACACLPRDNFGDGLPNLGWPLRVLVLKRNFGECPVESPGKSPRFLMWMKSISIS